METILSQVSDNTVIAGGVRGMELSWVKETGLLGIIVHLADGVTWTTQQILPLPKPAPPLVYVNGARYVRDEDADDEDHASACSCYCYRCDPDNDPD